MREFLAWRLADLGQDAREIALGIDGVPLAAGDQRPEPRVVLGSTIIPGEEPILAADGHALQRSLAGVVVNIEKALSVSDP